jgi:hypothetical protein
MDKTVIGVVVLPEEWDRARFATAASFGGTARCGIKARRFERQMGVRKSTTTTTVHGKAAREDEAQLCGLLHDFHYKA